MLVCEYTQHSGKNEMKEMIIWSDKYWLDWVESYHTSDNKMGRPPSGSLICLSRVWLQTELDDTKSYYQFIIKITIFKKRITKLWRKGKSALKKYSQRSRLDYRHSLVSGLRPSPRRTFGAFGGGARAPFPNSGWWSSLTKEAQTV